MIVYHGSTQIVPQPDVEHSFRNLDFGKGFYVTTVKEQAVRWARRKASLTKGGMPYLNVYCMKDVVASMNLRVRDFTEDVEAWIDFVCRCWDGKLDYQEYDLIKGKVANDKVYRVVDMYHSGIWDKERALKEIRVYPSYDQLAFITQNAVDTLLEFQEYQEV